MYYDDDEGGGLATPHLAHLEWHRNAGVPLGQPCPWDACDPYAGEAPMCEWFLLCDHEAVTTRPHPILGDVPICARCDEKMRTLDEMSARDREAVEIAAAKRRHPSWDES